MQPGLSRAVPMGILGFLGGALLAILIRMAQGLDPAGFVGPAMVLGSFISAGTFVWGMGGFDPRMSVHGEHEPAEDEHHEPEPEKITRGALVGALVWRTTFWTILGVLAVGAFGFLPQGPHIRNVQPGDGDVASVAFTTLGEIYNPLREFATTATALELLPPLSPELAAIQISYLVLLIVFVAIMMFSLFLAGGLFASAIAYFGRGKADPKSTQMPWRAIVFALIPISLLQMPLLIPSRELPMALLVPAFLLPPLLLLIAYRHWFWALLLVALLPLPLLVPTIRLTNMPPIMLALLGSGLVILALNLLRSGVAERTWRTLMFVVCTALIFFMVIYTIGLTRDDLWQLVFLSIIVVLSFTLILPPEYLRVIIPAGVAQRFAAVDWLNLIPNAAGWLAGVLRTGLPQFLGQK